LHTFGRSLTLKVSKLMKADCPPILLILSVISEDQIFTEEGYRLFALIHQLPDCHLGSQIGCFKSFHQEHFMKIPALVGEMSPLALYF
jgi:hypothetical protein